MAQKIARLLLAALLVPALLAGPRIASADPSVQKPVKTLISAVRYGKDEMALKYLAGPEQGEVLLGDEWEKATPEQREEFVKLFHTLFSGIAFPKIRDSFEHLETVVYAKPEMENGRAKLGSTLVVLHPLKKQEYKVEYVLVKKKEGWRVVDVTVLGTGQPSMLTDIREQQVEPIFAEGGWDHLLKLMRERAKEIGASSSN